MLICTERKRGPKFFHSVYLSSRVLWRTNPSLAVAPTAVLTRGGKEGNRAEGRTPVLQINLSLLSVLNKMGS